MNLISRSEKQDYQVTICSAGNEILFSSVRRHKEKGNCSGGIQPIDFMKHFERKTFNFRLSNGASD
jgi:hypothetical protein